MENCIYNSNDNITIGYYKDLNAGLKKVIDDYKKQEDWELFYQDLKRETGFTDEDIHYYFTEDEFKPKDGEIETEEFRYLIGKRVA